MALHYWWSRVFLVLLVELKLFWKKFGKNNQEENSTFRFIWNSPLVKLIKLEPVW